WASFEPIKMKVTMPKVIYDDLILEYERGNLSSNKDYNQFEFDLLLSNPPLGWQSKVIEGQIGSELWAITSAIYSHIISSKFPNGDIIAIFELGVSSRSLHDKSKLR